MASSRDASPANDSSPTSPIQLTPNSKVKALLASFDDDSDEQPVSNSVKAKLSSISVKSPKRSPTPTPNEPTPNNRSLLQDAEDDTSSSADEEEEDGDIVRPVGRMAARMQAAEHNSNPEAEKLPSDARERVKRMLMATSETPEPIVSDKESVDNNESDASIISRKRKVRVPRRDTPASSPERRSASPGLFVSPTKSSGHASDSDEDMLPTNPLKNDRFKALVERKRQERLEKEARKKEEKAKEMAERTNQAAMSEDDEINDDDLADRKLTQQTKPTRKAGKRALEAMAQETQRLSRNTQLAHQAKTRKRITKADLFKRYNFRGAASAEEVKPDDGPTSSSPAPHSDGAMHETPPTSPASHGSDHEKPLTTLDVQMSTGGQLKINQPQGEEEAELPTLENSLASSLPLTLDKGNENAIDQALPEPKGEELKQRPVRVRRAVIANIEPSVRDDSDSDLEIVPMKTPDARKKKLDTIFDRVPAKQSKVSHSLHTLKMLAHLKSPGKQALGKNQKSSLTASELQLALQQKARQQAALVREEREAALRAKGIIVQTAEEKEKSLAEVEDLISRARREGEEIRRQEKADAKKKKKSQGEEDLLGDSSDDEDWNDKNVNAEVDSMSGSGSEEDDASDASGEDDDQDDEEGEDEEQDELSLEADNEEETAATNPLFDDEADEDDEDEAEAELFAEKGMAQVDNMDDHQEAEEISVNRPIRRTRKSNVISDDEDEENSAMETPSAARTQSSILTKESPVAPNSVLRSASKTFIPGLTVAGPAGLGLTQIFAGTMDESQIEDLDEASTSPNSISKTNARQDSLAFLRGLPAPDLPPFVPTMTNDSQDVVVDSQIGANYISENQSMETQTQGLQLKFSQSQIHGFDSLVNPMATQFSEVPDATQDVGFQNMTPIRGRFVEAPPSTVDTVVMGQEATTQALLETPVVKKKGKLRRRAQVAAFSDEEDADVAAGESEQDDEFEISANVFDVMRKASKKKEVVIDEFDKKTSKAREMVHDQAEESEDDYAGLGGASDEGSDDEEDEYVKEMIDDEGGKDVDESNLAAFFADRERASDEKQVEKLYSDITKGLLRRKRGADYDLSDSDDGGEARKRMKRKEFAKMRKALLADERIGKIAENPKKEAFLRAIEDRGSEDEMDFLAEFGEQDDATDSQMSQAGVSEQRIPDSQPDVPMGPPKRKRSDTTETEARAPPQLRRTVPSKKPSNLSEIRESLSSLIEEPNAMMAPTPDSDSEGEQLEIEGELDMVSRTGEKENRDPFALRRKNVPIVDRISLKRASSSSLSNNARLAFAASSSAPGFQVPPLLRRATTNSSITSNSSGNSSVGSLTSATERMAGGARSDGIKRGGGKNSGVNYFARENERRAAVMKTEKRREQKLFKGAEVRRKVVGGLFGGGKFE